MRIRKISILGIGLFFGLFLGATILLYSPQKPSLSSPPTVGSSLPDFNLVLLNGDRINRNSLLGKPLVINFWATWCPPCREEMPLLEKFHVNNLNSVYILGINVDEDEKKTEEFLQQMGITFPIGIDKGGSISRLFFARSLPVTYFIDKEGIVRGQVIGMLTENVFKNHLVLIGILP